MAKREKKSEKTELPGLALAQFKAAAEATEEWAELPGCLLFVSRPHWVRFIGDTDAHDELFREKLKSAESQEVDPKEARKELRSFLQIWLATPEPESQLEFIVNQAYGKKAEALDDKGRSQLEKLVRDKLACLEGARFTQGIRSRIHRLDTCVGPCFEDVDTEVITRREDRVEREDIDQPFLRLRVRYTVRAEEAFPLFIGSPWGPRFPIPTKSFELECDERDIDLMIQRLSAAKETLRRSLEAKSTT